jgi:hypothetical protein
MYHQAGLVLAGCFPEKINCLVDISNDVNVIILIFNLKEDAVSCYCFDTKK